MSFNIFLVDARIDSVVMLSPNTANTCTTSGPGTVRYADFCFKRSTVSVQSYVFTLSAVESIPTQHNNIIF